MAVVRLPLCLPQNGHHPPRQALRLPQLSLLHLLQWADHGACDACLFAYFSAALRLTIARWRPPPLPSLQAKVPISEIKSITLKVINAIQIITTPPDCPKGKKVRSGYAQLTPSAIEPVRLLYDSDFFGLSSSASSTISVTGTTANGRSSHSMHSGESPRETPCVFHSRRASLLLAC